MLDDFRKASTASQARRRWGSSLVLSIAVCGAGGVAIVHATAAIQPPPEEVLIPVDIPRSLLPPPPAPVPVIPNHPPASIEIRRPRPPSQLPTEISQESNNPLPEPEPEPALEAPERVAPPALPPALPPRQTKDAPLIKPQESGSNQYARLKYPASAQRKAIQGDVVVRFDVLEDGSVANAEIIQGPKEFQQTVLDAAASWHFAPARQNGKPVRYRGMIKRVVFLLENAER